MFQIISKASKTYQLLGIKYLFNQSKFDILLHIYYSELFDFIIIYDAYMNCNLYVYNIFYVIKAFNLSFMAKV